MAGAQIDTWNNGYVVCSEAPTYGRVNWVGYVNREDAEFIVRWFNDFEHIHELAARSKERIPDQATCELMHQFWIASNRPGRLFVWYRRSLDVYGYPDGYDYYGESDNE